MRVSNFGDDNLGDSGPVQATLFAGAGIDVHRPEDQAVRTVDVEAELTHSAGAQLMAAARSVTEILEAPSGGELSEPTRDPLGSLCAEGPRHRLLGVAEFGHLPAVEPDLHWADSVEVSWNH
jgi:hypothetical protein